MERRRDFLQKGLAATCGLLLPTSLFARQEPCKTFTTEEPKRSYCDLWGGKEKLRQKLLGGIRFKRHQEGFTTKELSNYVCDDYDIVKDLEQGKQSLDGHHALSLMSPLGICVDKIMPLAPKELKGYWKSEWDNGVEKYNKQTAEEPIKIDPTTAIGLQWRFNALSELNTAA